MQKMCWDRTTAQHVIGVLCHTFLWADLDVAVTLLPTCDAGANACG
jgi:hypothetical protein